LQESHVNGYSLQRTIDSLSQDVDDRLTVKTTSATTKLSLTDSAVIIVALYASNCKKKFDKLQHTH